MWLNARILGSTSVPQREGEKQKESMNDRKKPVRSAFLRLPQMGGSREASMIHSFSHPTLIHQPLC